MLINEVKNTTNDLASKSNSGGYLPSDIFSNYAVLAQLSVINELYNALDYNMNVMTLLSVVLKESTVLFTNGLAAKPSDYYKYVSGSIVISENGQLIENDLEYIGRTERIPRKRSKIVEPDLDYPIISEIGSNFQVDPSTASITKITYIYQPTDPIWADDGSVPPVFDPNNSVDFVLGDQFKDILVNKILGYFGIEVRDPNIQNASIQQMIGAINK